MFNLLPWRSRENKAEGALTPHYDHPLRQMRDEMDAVFDRFFGNFMTPALGSWGLDCEDTEKEFVVRTDAPGFEPDDFDIQVGNHCLTIRAERKQENGKEGNGRGWSAQRSFQRSFSLPAGVGDDGIEARYRNGVLEVRLPKTEAAQGKRIPVKT
ncbi:MAG: Hsp20/alpha crystallin family protein [Planctomycetia bacterium]|nr:Hsp20/alpha crystallin family protein [Planctomycetia bacterium]